MTNPHLAKAELRLQMRATLAAARLDESGLAERSVLICDAIEAHPLWQSARVVCAFLPLAVEPRITPLLAGIPERRVCFPRLREGQIELICLDGVEALRRATWKLDLPEFDGAETVALGEVDVMLVPGLAFTRRGGRLGRGGGFYDRLLARREAGLHAWGVCFELQIVEELPREEHDLEVDAVVTEQGVSAPV